MLPILFGKVIRRANSVTKRYRIPFEEKSIKYPDFSDSKNSKYCGNWYFDPQQQRKLSENWHRHFANSQNVIAAADEICCHIFDLLGSGKTSLGKEIAWNCDFKSGRKWPSNRSLYPKEVGAPGGHADIKVPWELSRCQHFSTLGRTYWLTGDEKYAQEFVSQINSWIDNNSWGCGPNWACTMDVAIRAANWIMAWHFFRDSTSFDEVSRGKFIKSLWAHGWFIARNLERNKINSNHLISDLAGLFAVGIFFQNSKTGKMWRDSAINSLFDEMRVQVLDDGVDYEKSISYHRLVLELFSYSYILAELNGISIPEDIRTRWEKMFDFVSAYIKPDGTAPQIGDTDDGMFYKLSTPKVLEDETYSPFLDHRYLLCIGSVIFSRPDFAHVSERFSEEAFWLLGNEAVGKFDELLNAKAHLPESRAFEASGFYIMRSGSQYAIIDAGDNGMLGLGAHAHNDLLSFELCVNGETLIVDPGTYVYTMDPDLRNKFRSTEYHNTVMVDGEEIHPINKKWLFGLPNAGKAMVLNWETNGDKIIFEAQHDAYARLKDPVIHKRKITFDKSGKKWSVEDSFECKGEHRFESSLHFMPGINLAINQGTNICLKLTSKTAKHTILTENTANSNIQAIIEDYYYAPAYGRKYSAKVVCFRWKHCSDCKFVQHIG